MPGARRRVGCRFASASRQYFSHGSHLLETTLVHLVNPAYRREMHLHVLAGLLTLCAIALVPVFFLVAFEHRQTIGSRCGGVSHRLRLRRPAPAAPAGPPIEKLAADLRRLYPLAHFPRPGTRMPKQRGATAAYDGVLELAARALEVPTTLAELPEGFDHEVERLRVEHALAAAGLSWQVRAHDPPPDQTLR